MTTTRTSSSDNGTTRTSQTWASASTPSAQDRIEQYNNRPARVKPAKDPIFVALAWRSYHIPSFNWCEDWFQYFANNHPLLGICCHHPRHPIRTPMRLLNLLASVVFGLLLTNMIWLFFVLNKDHDADTQLITISLGDSENGLNTTRLEAVNDGSNEIAITEGMVMLWTLGGGIHALFDNTVWYLSACVCCLPCHSQESLERFQKYGTIFMVFAFLCIGAIASFCVVLRASLSDDDEEEVEELQSAGISDDQIDLLGFSDKSSFDFLLSYSVELALALFIYYPIVGTILFSGILGCGKVPILGGRPYEVLQEKKQIERKRRREARRRRPGEWTDHSSSSNGVNNNV